MKYHQNFYKFATFQKGGYSSSENTSKVRILRKPAIHGLSAWNIQHKLNKCDLLERSKCRPIKEQKFNFPQHEAQAPRGINRKKIR
jgi:hypothetical protein